MTIEEFLEIPVDVFNNEIKGKKFYYVNREEEDPYNFRKIGDYYSVSVAKGGKSWPINIDHVISINDVQAMNPMTQAIAGMISDLHQRDVYCNLYIAENPNADSFQIHIDETDNFILMVDGAMKLNLYGNEYQGPEHYLQDEPELLESIILRKGDFCYIPKYSYHSAKSLTSRISMSCYVEQPSTYNNVKRTVYYDPKKNPNQH